MTKILLLCISITPSEFLKLTIPSLFAALVAFMLFHMTTRRDRRKDKKKEKKDNRKKIMHFIYVVRESIKLVDAQHNALEKHIDEVKLDKFNSRSIGYYDKKSCELLVDILSDTATFSAVSKSQINYGKGIIETYSKINAKGIFINHLLGASLGSIKVNHEYIVSQSKLIQSYIDNLLQAINSLSIHLQKLEAFTDLDVHFVESVRSLDASLYGQEKCDIQTFYEFLILPFEAVIIKCKNQHFSNINALLEVARARDKAHRSYNELFGTHDIYVMNLQDEALKLRTECDNLKELIGPFDLKYISSYHS